MATFSVKQRRAIQDQLELLRRLNPDTEPFFHGHETEPFLIKNLENVQGDERDVIFISVGYGRDAQGRFTRTRWLYVCAAYGGLQRSGPRIQSAAERAITAAVQAQKVALDDRILLVPGVKLTVRDRSQVSSPGLRKPELLPPKEVQTAVLEIVTVSFGATEDEIVRDVSRRFGYARTSAQLRTVILYAISTLESVGDLTKQGELRVLGQLQSPGHV